MAARAIPPHTSPAAVTDAACWVLRHLLFRARILAALFPSTTAVNTAADLTVTVQSSLVCCLRGSYVHKFDVEAAHGRADLILLLSRKDLDGRAMRVHGRGVVRLKPLIHQGESFGCGSGVALQADWAETRGSYQELTMRGGGGGGAAADEGEVGGWDG